MENMKISFIATSFNEEKSIGLLMESLLDQTRIPDEIVIIDGGSFDATVKKIKSYDKKFKYKKVRFVIYTKKGNRSVGRNEAIKMSRGDIVVCSDAGCILDKKWVEFITNPFLKNNIDVVAGYYKGKSKNVFQKCLVQYVLVMPDKVDSNAFLPASRSMAFKKEVWEQAGGFPEEYSHNEDYVFAKKLKKLRYKIFFEKRALVEWIPPKSHRNAFAMFFRFAMGDIQAKILRPKVLFIFLRYILGIFLLVYVIISKDMAAGYGLLVLFVAYYLWAIAKNYKYVNRPEAIFILPILQISSDLAVISGTLWGVINYGVQK